MERAYMTGVHMFVQCFDGFDAACKMAMFSENVGTTLTFEDEFKKITTTVEVIGRKVEPVSHKSDCLPMCIKTKLRVTRCELIVQPAAVAPLEGGKPIASPGAVAPLIEGKPGPNTVAPLDDGKPSPSTAAPLDDGKPSPSTAAPLKYHITTRITKHIAFSEWPYVHQKIESTKQRVKSYEKKIRQSRAKLPRPVVVIGWFPNMNELAGRFSQGYVYQAGWKDWADPPIECSKVLRRYVRKIRIPAQQTTQILKRQEHKEPEEEEEEEWDARSLASMDVPSVTTAGTAEPVYDIYSTVVPTDLEVASKKPPGASLFGTAEPVYDIYSTVVPTDPEVASKRPPGTSLYDV